MPSPADRPMANRARRAEAGASRHSTVCPRPARVPSAAAATAARRRGPSGSGMTATETASTSLTTVPTGRREATLAGESASKASTARASGSFHSASLAAASIAAASAGGSRSRRSTSRWRRAWSSETARDCSRAKPSAEAAEISSM